jgi:hypothetical protein
MPGTVNPNPRRSRRARMFTVGVLAGGLLLAGCAEGSPSRTATVAGHGSSPASGATDASSDGPRAGHSGQLAFAECMRANGVPSFPDPEPGGGTDFVMPAGANPAAPAFRVAQSKCQKLLAPAALPDSGPPSTTTLIKLRKIARCMRQHGISDFPDPSATRPANLSPGEYVEVTDFDGAFLLLPATLNTQAPAYKQALTACHAPPIGLPH